ncbi:hypothetical protein [Xenorhabdus griffiniae]|uniref:hypothetical protein n=1 Tax=Xenorhabdus griffiniae TaxID=351672 RepID=UPI0030D210FF
MVYLPRPNPRCIGCARLAVAALLARYRARHLRPVQPPEGASLEQSIIGKTEPDPAHQCLIASQCAAGGFCATRTRRTSARRPNELGDVRPLPKVKSLTKSGYSIHHKPK